LKVDVECAGCLLHRGLWEIAEATDDRSLRFQVTSALFRLLAKEFRSTAVPAYLGTERDRLIKRMTGNCDPYAEIKQRSNREPGHAFKYEDIGRLVQGAEDDLAVDEIAEIFHAVREARRILFLTDNAGEIALDTLLVGELKRLGAHVTVAVKGGPIINDATMEDATFVGLDKVADDVITTGTDGVGLMPEQCSREFLDVYESVDLVMAKGMGYVETLTELDLSFPHSLLLRTKCQPVADFLRVERGKNIAMLMA